MRFDAAVCVLVIGAMIGVGCVVQNGSCVPGQQISCGCGGGASGIQVCQSDHTYGGCVCGDSGADVEGAARDALDTNGDRADTDGFDGIEVDSADAGRPLDVVLDAAADDSEVGGSDDGGDDAAIGLDSAPDSGTASDAGAGSDATSSATFWATAAPCGFDRSPAALPAGTRRLFPLGQTRGVPVGRSATRVLAAGTDYSAGGLQWNLWEVGTRTRIAHGELPASTCPVGRAFMMAGDIVVVPNGCSQVDVRSASDGSTVASISGVGAMTSFALSSDGSYLVGKSPSAISAWSTSSGVARWTLTGSYRLISVSPDPLVVASATEVLVANESGSIEHIEPVTGGRTLSSFAGFAMRWTNDGGHLITNTSGTVSVYEPNGLRTSILPLSPSAVSGGFGSYLFGGSPLTVYDMTSGAVLYGAASGSYSSSGSDVAVWSADGRAFDLVHLAGSSVTTTHVTSAVPGGGFARDNSSGHWVVGSNGAMITDEFAGATPPLPLGCGQVMSVLEADDGTFAVRTRIGIVVGSVGATSDSIRGAIPGWTTRAAIASDGSFIEAMSDVSLDQFDSHDGSVVRSIPLVEGTTHQTAVDFDMSSSGNALSRTYTGPFEIRVSDISGTVVSWTDSSAFMGFPPPIASPSQNGTRIARPNYRYFGGGLGTLPPSTQIYRAGVLRGSLMAMPSFWLDDARLVVSQYAPDARGTPTYAGQALVDETGTVLTSVPTAGVRASSSTILLVPSGALFDADSRTTSSAHSVLATMTTTPMIAVGQQIVGVVGDDVLAEPMPAP